MFVVEENVLVGIFKLTYTVGPVQFTHGFCVATLQVILSDPSPSGETPFFETWLQTCMPEEGKTLNPDHPCFRPEPGKVESLVTLLNNSSEMKLVWVAGGPYLSCFCTFYPITSNHMYAMSLPTVFQSIIVVFSASNFKPTQSITLNVNIACECGRLSTQFWRFPLAHEPTTLAEYSGHSDFKLHYHTNIGTLTEILKKAMFTVVFV